MDVLVYFHMNIWLNIWYHIMSVDHLQCFFFLEQRNSLDFESSILRILIHLQNYVVENGRSKFNTILGIVVNSSLMPSQNSFSDSFSWLK